MDPTTRHVQIRKCRFYELDTEERKDTTEYYELHNVAFIGRKGSLSQRRKGKHIRRVLGVFGGNRGIHSFIDNMPKFVI